MPMLSACGDYEEGGGVPCQPNAASSCTGRNPFCAQMDDKSSFKCCSDRVQDSSEITNLKPEHTKPSRIDLAAPLSESCGQMIPAINFSIFKRGLDAQLYIKK